MPTIVNEIWIAMADLAYQVKDIRLSVRNRDLDSRVVALFDDRRPGVHIYQPACSRSETFKYGLQ